MEIRKNGIIIKTTDGYTFDDSNPPMVEILDAISGQPICKLRVNGVGHACGQEWVERLEFEEEPLTPEEQAVIKLEHKRRLDLDIADQIGNTDRPFLDMPERDF